MCARPSRSRCARLLGGERRPLPDAVEHAARAIGDAAVELAVRVAIERAAGGFGVSFVTPASSSALLL